MHPWTKSNVSYYHRHRAWLVTQLGGVCALASDPAHKCSGPLHIDHVDGRNWEEREVSSHQRIRRLIQEYKEGRRLRLLCAKANGWDGGKRGGNGRPLKRA